MGAFRTAYLRLPPPAHAVAPEPILLMLSLKELMAEPTVKHPEPILWLALLKKRRPELTLQDPGPILLTASSEFVMAETNWRFLTLFFASSGLFSGSRC